MEGGGAGAAMEARLRGERPRAPRQPLPGGRVGGAALRGAPAGVAVRGGRKERRMEKGREGGLTVGHGPHGGECRSRRGGGSSE